MADRLANALTFINELTEDIERSANRIIEADKKVAELTEENERLRAENETLKVATNDQYAHLCECHDNIAKMLQQKEAHTVMKMHSEIQERCIKGGIYPAFVKRTIDQIAKEMLEGKTNDS